MIDFEKMIETMQEGGKILEAIFYELEALIKPKTPTLKIDKKAGDLFKKFKVKSAFKGYKPEFSKKTYPNNICISLNETIVHGLARKDKILQEGDLVKLDIGIVYKNFYLDAAKTIGVGEISLQKQRLIQATREALDKAIKTALPGHTLGDIGYIIQKTITSYNFKVIKNLCGHDIGNYLHGKIQVLNFGERGRGLKLKEGMIFTIEPMASISSEYGIQVNDFEFVTEDSSVSAHFEATLAILKDQNLVLTNIF